MNLDALEQEVAEQEKELLKLQEEESEQPLASLPPEEEQEEPQLEEEEEVEELEEPEDLEEEQEEIDVDDEPEEELDTSSKDGKAFARLRKEKKEKEREAQELRERLARFEGAQSERDAQAQQAAQPVEKVEPEPDYEMDPEAHLKWRSDNLERKINEFERKQARVEGERAWERMEESYANSADGKNYLDAKNFLVQHEKERIKSLHPSASEAQIAEHIRAEELKIVAATAAVKDDPLSKIEFLAYKAGFRPGENQEEAPQAPKKRNMKKYKENVNKSASLIGGTPKVKMAPPSLQDMINMDLDEAASMSNRELNSYG